jgi:hypothetical protein
MAVTVLMCSAMARAELTGTIWRVPGNDLNAGPNSVLTPGTVEEGTFTTSTLDYQVAEGGGQGTFGTLAQFLASGGVTYIGAGAGDIMTGDFRSDGATSVTQADLNCYNPGRIANTCYSTVIELSGSASFVANKTYFVSHDDGIVLFLGGKQASFNNSNDGGAGPTSQEKSQFGFRTAQTDISFDLWYMATNGNPSILQISPNFDSTTIATPEVGAVSTLITMLTGLAAFAGIFRKRMA